MEQWASLSPPHTHKLRHTCRYRCIHTFFLSLSLSYTHIHTVYSIKIKWTVWKHKAQQASLVSYFRWWFKADHTTTGREAAEQEAKTEARPQSAAAAFCQPATASFFSVCPFVCVYFSLSPPLAEDEWVMLYRRPGDGIHAAIGDRHTTNRRSAVFEVPHYSQVTSPQFSNTVGQTGRKNGGNGQIFFAVVCSTIQKMCA